MSVAASYLYRDGQRVGDFDFHSDAAPTEENAFVWIGLCDPDAHELEAVRRTFGLHHLAVEDALSGKQVPKVDIYRKDLFVFVKTAHIEEDAILYGETAIFLGPHYTITVRHGSTRTHKNLREQLEATPDLLKGGPAYVLHGVLDFIVDGYLPIVRAIEDRVLDMEQRMLDSFLKREEIKRLFHLRREMIHFERILGPVEQVCGKLAHLHMPCIDDETRNYFQDVHDHVVRIEAMTAGLKEVTTSVFEASNLFEQQRQSDISRRLAAWAAIAAIPTSIAGIYGMNFENIPELKSPHGYHVAIAVMTALCGTLFWRFKKSGWL
jgi:magnesium transporter